MIKFNQNTSLKPYIDINADLRKKARNGFEKYFYKLINNAAVYGKTMENVRKQRHIKLVATERKTNYRTFIGLLILELIKILMYDFWYDYVKPQYDEKAKLCYMDTV